MKKILFPTDFSENANNALRYAIEIANQFGSQITLLHTYKVYSSTGMFISVESYMEKEAEEAIGATARQFGPLLGEGMVFDHRILRGDAITMITRMAEIQKYDLIIMGTQGASGFKEVFIGSVTNGVIKQAATPVLAIPAGFEFRPLENIVFAVDAAGISSEKIVVPLVELAAKYSARLRVYHKDTGQNDPGIAPDLDRFLKKVEHSFHYELGSDVVTKSIAEFAIDYEADLLCLLRRNRSFLEEVFHQSVTSRSAFHTEIPLLVLQEE